MNGLLRLQDYLTAHQYDGILSCLARPILGILLVLQVLQR